MEYPKCQYQDEDINANVCPRHTPEETRKSASKRSANVKGQFWYIMLLIIH